MRRIAIIMAGAALAVALVVPNVAEAGGRGGHHRGGRHGHHEGRHRHGYHRSGIWWPGGVHCGRGGCYGVYPGYWGFPYGYGGYWGGGFGCNFDYPCGPPFDERCRSFRGAPAADPRCQAEQKGEPTAPAPGAQPAPDQNAQPAPEQGQPPAPDQGTEPQPAPEEGEQPRPY